MSQQQKRSGFGIGLIMGGAFIACGFAGVLLLPLAVTLVEFLIGGTVGILLASVYLFGLTSTKERVVQAADAVHAAATTNRYDPVKDRDRALAALVAQNQKLRTTSGVAPSVLASAEILIDRLSELLMRLYGEYPNEETTWTIGTVATDHLPELLKQYVSIAADMRAKAEESVLSGMEALLQEVSTITTMFDVNDLQGAKAQAEALKARFGRQDFVPA